MLVLCIKNEIFELLKPSKKIKKIKFFSFQVDIEDKNFPEELIDLSEQLESFNDTIAAIEQFDLVISVDTFLAHLAGAMDKKTFLLLPYRSEWRWLDSQDGEIFWYPKMRAFKQEKIFDWSGVLKKVSEEIEKIVD